MATVINIKDLKEDLENPRKISEDNKIKLEKSIKVFGDISGIVFNTKTQTLISGHQRLKLLKEKYPDIKLKLINNKYELVSKDVPVGFSVRTVSWDIEKQKAGNLVANSKDAQGEFVQDQLDYILNSYNLDDFTDFDLKEITEINKDIKAIDLDVDVNDSREVDETQYTIFIKIKDMNCYDDLINEMKRLHEKYQDKIELKF